MAAWATHTAKAKRKGKKRGFGGVVRAGSKQQLINGFFPFKYICVYVCVLVWTCMSALPNHPCLSRVGRSENPTFLSWLQLVE